MHLFLFRNPTVLYILFGFGFFGLESSPDASPPFPFGSSPDAFPPSLFRPATSFPWPQERQQADPSPWIITQHGRVRDVAITCINWCVQFVIFDELQAKTLKMQYDFTIAIRRPLRTVSTLMQASHTARSCEGCGNMCVRQFVRVVRDIGRAASLNF